MCVAVCERYSYLLSHVTYTPPYSQSTVAVPGVLTTLYLHGFCDEMESGDCSGCVLKFSLNWTECLLIGDI